MSFGKYKQGKGRNKIVALFVIATLVIVGGAFIASNFLSDTQNEIQRDLWQYVNPSYVVHSTSSGTSTLTASSTVEASDSSISITLSPKAGAGNTPNTITCYLRSGGSLITSVPATTQGGQYTYSISLSNCLVGTNSYFFHFEGLTPPTISYAGEIFKGDSFTFSIHALQQVPDAPAFTSTPQDRTLYVGNSPILTWQFNFAGTGNAIIRKDGTQVNSQSFAYSGGDDLMHVISYTFQADTAGTFAFTCTVSPTNAAVSPVTSGTTTITIQTVPDEPVVTGLPSGVTDIATYITGTKWNDDPHANDVPVSYSWWATDSKPPQDVHFVPIGGTLTVNMIGDNKVGIVWNWATLSTLGTGNLEAVIVDSSGQEVTSVSVFTTQDTPFIIPGQFEPTTLKADTLKIDLSTLNSGDYTIKLRVEVNDPSVMGGVAWYEFTSFDIRVGYTPFDYWLSGFGIWVTIFLVISGIAVFTLAAIYVFGKSINPFGGVLGGNIRAYQR